MILNDMFKRPITREIQSVIKVGEDSDSNIKQELEEYVVTQELQRHFADFFAAYKKGIIGNTDKVGVWISGFYGSGKSHFLKILSYLLDDEIVEGKRATDYFVDDEKIQDSLVLADMELASKTPGDIILFNIDSKGKSSAKASEHALVDIFLNVFNEKQGFYGSNPAIADLERTLAKQGRLDEFKQRFAEKNNVSWEEGRNEFDFKQDETIAVLVEMNFMQEEAARNWANKALQPYQMSIQDFVSLVKDYIDAQNDSNYHVVFLVDELGQYVGDNTDLTLNVQTLTEELGKQCQGKAWIIVTSQQNIDEVTEVKGHDFSKIQDRFDTKLSLSSTNVDEVIRKRVLEKKESAEDSLMQYYHVSETKLKNLLTFNDVVEKKLFSDSDDFAQVYPFVPYQFNTLTTLLKKLRVVAGVGRSISEGERPMLAMFKQAAEKYKDDEIGALVPLYTFYDSMEEKLDHSHRIVVTNAKNNSQLNPDEEEDPFSIQLLKTLFMVKYIDDIEANSENLTTLIVDSVDADRISLKEKVEYWLGKLVEQNFVLRQGDIYIFQTDEEQEVNHEIQSIPIPNSELIHKVSEMLFEDLRINNSYKMPNKGNRYVFKFNRKVDDTFYKNQKGEEQTLQIVTELYDNLDGHQLKAHSVQENNVVIALAEGTGFLEEATYCLQIANFLRSGRGRHLAKFDVINTAKQAELRERENRAKTQLKEAIAKADVYVHEESVSLKGKDSASIIEASMGKLIDRMYSKLGYIEHIKSEKDTENLILNRESGTQSVIDETDSNPIAKQELLRYIVDKTDRHNVINIRNILNHFAEAPYGFVEEDVEWLIAALFVNNAIRLVFNGTDVSFLKNSSKEIIDYITNNNNADRVLVQIRQEINPEQIRKTQTVLKDVLNVNNPTEDEDEIFELFRNKSEMIIGDLREYQAIYDGEHFIPYPGKEVVQRGLKLLRECKDQPSSNKFYEAVEALYDDLQDFGDDIQEVETFFKHQKDIFDLAETNLKMFEQSKSFITNKELEKFADSMKEIMQKDRPYSFIPQLNELNANFAHIHMRILDEESEPVCEEVKKEKTLMLELLNYKPYKEDKRASFEKPFDDLIEKAKKLTNIALLNLIPREAKSIYDKIKQEIVRLDAKYAPEPALPLAETGNSGKDQVIPSHEEPIIKTKPISLNNVLETHSWKVETEEDIKELVQKLETSLTAELLENTVLIVEL